MKSTEMLKKNYEFKYVLTKGNFYVGKYMQAFIKENDEKERNLLGLAISTKVRKSISKKQNKKTNKRKL